MFVVLIPVGFRAYSSLSANPTESESDLDAMVEPQPRLPVRVVRAEQGLVQKWVFDNGIVWPVKRQILAFQAEGDILSIARVNGRPLRVGDFVTQGQVLATLDSRRQQSAMETADADLDVAVQERNQAQANVVQAETSLDQAQSDLELANRELTRYKELFDQGVISESDLDVYLYQVEQKKAGLEKAEQDVRSAEDGVRSAEAKIRAAQARRKEVNVDMEDTKLIAPIDGVVAYINIQEGEYWTAQRLSATTEEVLLESAPIILVNPQDIEVEIEIQADVAKTIRAGQVAHVVLEEDVSAAQSAGVGNQGLLDIAQAQGSRGTVFSVSPTQTPGSRGTQVNIRNFQLTQRLRLGGRAYVWIEVAANPNAVLVPLQALLPQDQNVYTFVVNEADGTVEKRLVQPGIDGLSRIEIVRGVEPGEFVVTEGVNRLVDGTPVEIVEQGVE
ncbi:MAG: multidrug transporter [Leptolyngbyaceae bacterium]|nr:multidrug transporter [Leptolyngbyaceae bacterium]